MTKTVKTKIIISQKLFDALNDWRMYAILRTGCKAEKWIRLDNDVITGQNGIGTIKTDNHNTTVKTKLFFTEPMYEFGSDKHPTLLLQIFDADDWKTPLKEKEVSFNTLEYWDKLKIEFDGTEFLFLIDITDDDSYYELDFLPEFKE